MPLSLADLQTPLTKEEVRDTLTDSLTVLGFPVTAWQDGGVARSFLEMMSELGSSLSQRVASLAKMVDLSTAEGEFLDAKAESDFDEKRNAAVSAVLDVTFTNSGATTYGPFVAGALLVRSASGQIFASTGAATITASTATVVEVSAQLPGSAGSIAAETLQLVTPLAGVVATSDGTLTGAGADAEADPQYRERARTKWGTLRIEKSVDGVKNLALNAAPSLTDVTVVDTNPRGPGTVDVYLAAATATAGGGDVTLVQTALDLAFLGNGASDQLVQAFAATTQTQDLTATVYVRGITAADATDALTAAWQAFIATIPIGGFDLSPGPVNTVQRGQIIEALADVSGVVSVDLATPAADLVSLATSVKILEGTTTFNIIVLAAT